MDGREGMAMFELAPYYMQRGIGGPVIGSQHPKLYGQLSGIQSMPNPGLSMAAQSSGMGASGGMIGSAAFQVESSPTISPRSCSVGSGGHVGVGLGAGEHEEEAREALEVQASAGSVSISSAMPPRSAMGS